MLPFKTVTTAESSPAAAAQVTSSTGAPAAAAASAAAAAIGVSADAPIVSNTAAPLSAAESDSAAAAHVNNSTTAPAAESGSIAAAHVNSSSVAPIAAADVSIVARAGVNTGFYCDQLLQSAQQPSQCSSSSSSSRRPAEQQKDVTDSVTNRLAVTAAATSYPTLLEATCPRVAAQPGMSAITAAADHELLASTPLDPPDTSSSSSCGGSSISTLRPGVPGNYSSGLSGLGEDVTSSGLLAKLLVSADTNTPHHHHQQQLQAQATAPGRLHQLLLQSVAATQCAAESTAAGDSQVVSVHSQQSPAPDTVTLAVETVSLPCLRVVTQAQTAMRQPQQLQQQQQPASATATAAVAARAAGAANICQRHFLSGAAAVGVTDEPPLGGYPLEGSFLFGPSLGASPFVRHKRRSSEATQFDVAWPCQQQQQQDPLSCEVSAGCSSVSKLESAIVTPAVKRAKIEAEDLLARMSAVVAPAYGAAAAQRAVTAAYAELQRHGYVEAK